MAQAAPAPLPFVENRGQWDFPARFVATVPGGWLFLENTAFTYNLQPNQTACPSGHEAKAVAGHAYRVRLLGANPTPVLRGDDQQAVSHNYFIGNDSKRWAANVPLFGGVRYEQVYPGVGLHWHQAQGGQLEYDFEVAAGADARCIRLRYEGLDAVSLSAEGHLVLRTSVGTVREQAPVAWQPQPGGGRRAVACRFLLKGLEVRFALGAGYDPTQPLLIDPTLLFATYSGSTGGESGNATAYDAQGNLFTGGYAIGPNFPVTLGAYQRTYYYGCMILAKFSANGTALLSATYLSGTGAGIGSVNNYPLNLLVNPAGELLVLGTTDDATFPTTAGAYDRSYNGARDYVLARFNAAGTALLASTFLGGAGAEGGLLSGIAAGLDLAANGDVLVSGATTSLDFPVRNAQQSVSAGNYDGVVARLAPGLDALQWSTYLGGSAPDYANEVKEAPDGTVYVGGQTYGLDFPVGTGGLNPRAFGNGDGFVLRLRADGVRLAGTFLGTQSADLVRFLDFDAAGNVLAGGASDGLYPVTAGALNAMQPNSTGIFIHCLDPTLSRTSFAAQLGVVAAGLLRPPGNLATGANVLLCFGRDQCGRLYLSSYAGGIGCPLTPNALNTQPRSLYLAVLSADASALLYGTYLGEPNSFTGPSLGTHLHYAASNKVSRTGVMYHIQCTTSSAFGTTPGVWSPTRQASTNDGVAFKFDLSPSSQSVPVRAAVSPVATGCSPLAVQFVNQSTGNPTRYRWKFGDGSAPDTTQAPQHTFTTPGTFTVHLLARRPGGVGSCSAAPQLDSTQLTVTVLPTGLQQRQDSLGCGQALVLDPQQAGAAYAWNTGATTPTLAVARPGTYSVRITQSICPVTVQWTVTAITTRLPNIITLNGDHLNELLKVPTDNGTAQLRVYSRWGKLVYETGAYHDEWPAPDVPAGVYYYLVQQASCTTTTKGWVEVVR